MMIPWTKALAAAATLALGACATTTTPVVGHPNPPPPPGLAYVCGTQPFLFATFTARCVPAASERRTTVIRAKG
jgi:hypothetical protein